MCIIAHARRQTSKPLDELGATISSLEETSRRIDIASLDADDAPHPENPAAKFACSLIEKRDVPSTTALSAAMINSKTSNNQPQSALVDIQFPPGLMDIPTMLQQFATSPSSGISWLGMNAPEQEANTDTGAGGGTSNLVNDNVLALTQSLMPNARMAHNISAYQAQYSPLGGQGNKEFDFIAELQRMGSRARAKTQNTDTETQGTTGRS